MSANIGAFYMEICVPSVKILFSFIYEKKFFRKFQLADTISCLRTAEVKIITYLLQMKNKRNAVLFSNHSTCTDQSKERL